MTIISTLTNKHIVVALLVAPLLAVGAWYLVGFAVDGDAMKPQPALTGESYPLVERSGCRYGGGRCVLANGDLELAISVTDRELVISPSVPIDQVVAGLAALTESAPLAAVWDEALSHWSVALPEAPSATDRLRVVASRNNSQFYGEASLTFLAGAD